MNYIHDIMLRALEGELSIRLDEDETRHINEMRRRGKEGLTAKQASLLNVIYLYAADATERRCVHSLMIEYIREKEDESSVLFSWQTEFLERLESWVKDAVWLYRDEAEMLGVLFNDVASIRY